ncbi:MAG TPA: hypothetical protein VF334_19885 [Polyangia bacterium]
MSGRRLAAALALLAVAAALLVIFSRRHVSTVAVSARGADDDDAAAPWRSRIESATRSSSAKAPGTMVPPPPAVLEHPAAPPARPPYSPDTFRLAAEIKPGASEWDETPSDPNGTFVLRLRPTAYVVRPPSPIAVELEVLDTHKRRQAVARAELQLRGSGKDAPVHTFEFFDDGSGLYTATYQPGDGERAQLLGHVLGQAQVQLRDGKSYLLSTSLVYSVEPGARIVGEFSDERRAGDLYIGMTLAVDHAGLYQVRGELFAPTLDAIAETRMVRSLDPGRARVELHFFGKAIADRGLNGPYLLRDLYVTEHLASADYDAMGPVLDDAWRTQPYRAVDFSSQPYQPPPPSAPVVNAFSPSEQQKPPPLFGARATGPTTALASSPSVTVALHPDVVAPPR